MRVVVQRVSSARVLVSNETVGEISLGLMVLVAVTPQDGEAEVRWLARKCAALRIFPDLQGRMNLSLKDVGGEALVVSQFTLYGNAVRGNRPSFVDSAGPEFAEPLYESFCEALGAEIGRPVATGRFGENMEVELTNAGPVTLILDRDRAPENPRDVAGLPPLALDAPAPAADARVPAQAQSVIDLIKHRRSVTPANFRPDPVPAAWVDTILQAGSWAPSHGKNEPWRFVLCRGEGLRELGEQRIRSYHLAVPEENRKPGKEEKIRLVHSTAPLAIAIGCCAGANPLIPASEDRLAVACAAENMMLAATALGLGSFWTTGALAYHDSMREFLGFDTDVEPMGFLLIGFSAKPWPEAKRSELGSRLEVRD